MRQRDRETERQQLRYRGGRELPPKVVQHLLGHSSIVMTLDRYGHLFPRGDDRAELAAVARRCWPTRNGLLGLFGKNKS